MITETMSTKTDVHSDLKLCAACGQTLLDGEWHPVSTEKNEDGDFVLYSFCDEDCHSAWETFEKERDFLEVSGV